MIGFGELRRRSLEWKQDIGAVERTYATDWLLKGIFDQALLASALALRGASALRYAYCPDYTLAESPEFLIANDLENEPLHNALIQAAQTAAEASRLSIVLLDFHRGTAKFDYAGPLGRRSAAQPHITLLLLPGRLRLPPTHVPLLHPFADSITATVTAVAFEEWAAERIVGLAQAAPRARDIYDLWFALAHECRPIDAAQVRALVEEIAREKNVVVAPASALFAPRRETLARVWQGALRNVPGHPSLEQVETELIQALGNLDLPGL